MASDNSVSRFLPDIVVCIREAVSSGKKLSWTLKKVAMEFWCTWFGSPARMLSSALKQWALKRNQG